MAAKAKQIKDQVVVITGASSGIGRETALLLAEGGASVVLAARNTEALDEVARQVESRGGRALAVVTDVAQWGQVQRLASEAVAHFGRIDTWVNNAGISEYATLEDIPVADMERIIQVNLLGTMYGVKAALPYLKQQTVATIINVGSGLGMRAIPLQGTYCTTKSAIKGFTEALRMELAHDHPNVRATLILPAAIDTPFYKSARNLMGFEPQPPPPVYAPRNVAEAILDAATHARRDVYVGSASKSLAVLESAAPATMDAVLSRAMYKMQQQRDQPVGASPGNLDTYVPGAGSVQDGWHGRPVSLYTRLFALHPRRTRLLGLFALGAAVWLAARRASDSPSLGNTQSSTTNTVPEKFTPGRNPTPMPEYTHSAAITVNAPVSQVYALFSHFNDFPKFMSYIKEVTYKDSQTSHWVADVAGSHEWDAVNENWIEGKQIGWRSTSGIQNHGSVTFETVGDSQTKVVVSLSYDPPVGVLGDAGEKLGVGKHFEQKLQHDLDHFAQMVAQAPIGALDPESSNYLFHDDSAAAKGKTTTTQDATMADNT